MGESSCSSAITHYHPGEMVNCKAIGGCFIGGRSPLHWDVLSPWLQEYTNAQAAFFSLKMFSSPQTTVLCAYVTKVTAATPTAVPFPEIKCNINAGVTIQIIMLPLSNICPFDVQERCRHDRCPDLAVCDNSLGPCSSSYEWQHRPFIPWLYWISGGHLLKGEDKLHRARMCIYHCLLENHKMDTGHCEEGSGNERVIHPVPSYMSNLGSISLVGNK